jgi:hypothetical protein
MAPAAERRAVGAQPPGPGLRAFGKIVEEPRQLGNRHF